MKLRTRKRLLNFSTLGCLVTATGILWSAFTAKLPSIESEMARNVKTDEKLSTKSKQLTQTVDAKQASWQRQLRHPLYDPPPPPKVVVKKKVRPVTVKLTGTVLEPNNSQAFLRLPNGSLALKSLGDQVTDDPRDGHIAEITATAIVIKREDDEVRLQVEGQN